MGNGSMGSYICKEPGKNAIRVDVGNSMVHDHRTDDASIYGRGRLLIGYFLLHPVGEIKSGDLRLDLWNAETTGCIRTTRGEIKLRACVTSESPYILVEAEATAGEKEFTWKFYPENTDSPRQLNAIRKSNKNHLKKDYVSNPAPQLSARNGLNLCWQPLLAGGGTATAWKEIRKENTSTLIVSNAHSFPGTEALQKAETALASLQEADLPVLRKAHREWWHNYYPQSFVSLPDKKMENFYWAQMYKLASATRTGGGLLDNSGPWQVLTPWPNAWWNLNVQLSYWSVYPSNRLELGMPLVDAIGNNLDNLINNVPEPYRKDAAALPVATDFTLTGATVNVPGTEKKAQVGNLTWICHNLWLQYRFSMDESILRNTLYPTLRRAVNFYLPFLTEDKSGKLHLKRTYSPEYGTAEDCNYDIALLRWGCNTLLEASRILSVDDELIPRWKQVAEHLTDYPQDENGMMIGKDVPFSRSHRHYSHLLMFYPLYLLNAEQNGSKELMEKSVEHWAQPAGQYPRIYLYGGFFAVCCIRRGRQGAGETQRPVCPHPAPQHHVHGKRTGYRDPVVGRTVHTRHAAAKLGRKDTCIPCRTFPMERCTVQGPENRRRFPRIRCAERRKDKLHPYQKPCRRTVYPTHRYGKSGCKGRQCHIDPAKRG